MNDYNFTAVDFETVSSAHKSDNGKKQRSYICQIGLVVVRNGVVVKKYEQLIKPPIAVFNPFTVRVHHIHPEDVADKPTFEEVWPNIEQYFCNTRIVAHNKSTEETILKEYLDDMNIMCMGLGQFDCTCRYYRKKKLSALCAGFHIPFDEVVAHSALYDAEKCAALAMHMYAGDEPDWDIVDSFYQKKSPAKKNIERHVALKGDVLKKDLSHADPDNPFYDRKVVITGVFQQDRKWLAKKLKSMGADIDTSISKKTNFVLIGTEPGPSKIEQLDKLIFNGYNIRRLDQFDLNQILDHVWGPYMGDKIIEKKLDFTMEHFTHHHLTFKGEYNVIASKEIYLSKDLKGDRTSFNVVLGNLGAFDSHELCKETNICVLSTRTINLLEQGIKDDTIKQIETFYNNNRAVVFEFSFMTDKDIVDWCRERCLRCGDDLTMKYLQRYIDSQL